MYKQVIVADVQNHVNFLRLITVDYIFEESTRWIFVSHYYLLHHRFARTRGPKLKISPRLLSPTY